MVKNGIGADFSIILEVKFIIRLKHSFTEIKLLRYIDSVIISLTEKLNSKEKITPLGITR